MSEWSTVKLKIPGKFTVSYAITVKDEIPQFKELILKLSRWLADVDYTYEIHVVHDTSTNVEGWRECSRWLYEQTTPRILCSEFPFQGDFARFKNKVNDMCVGDYIFQIDADEYPSTILVQQIGQMIKMNPSVDLYWLPRVNTVSGLTTEHIVKWGWGTTALEGVDLMAVNWPDYQGRLYRNAEGIKWVGAVHERIEGAKIVAKMPAETIWALYHPKDIARQERQNEMYSKIQR